MTDRVWNSAQLVALEVHHRDVRDAVVVVWHVAELHHAQIQLAVVVRLRESGQVATDSVASLLHNLLGRRMEGISGHVHGGKRCQSPEFDRQLFQLILSEIEIRQLTEAGNHGLHVTQFVFRQV